MTTPMLRAIKRAERLNEGVAAFPLRNTPVIRAIARLYPPKRCSGFTDYATA